MALALCLGLVAELSLSMSRADPDLNHEPCRQTTGGGAVALSADPDLHRESRRQTAGAGSVALGLGVVVLIQICIVLRSCLFAGGGAVVLPGRVIQVPSSCRCMMAAMDQTPRQNDSTTTSKKVESNSREQQRQQQSAALIQSNSAATSGLLS